MRFILGFLFLIGGVSFCKAQDEVLPIDERGKFIYYELVEVKEGVKSQFKERVSSFLKKPGKDLKLKENLGDTVFIAKGKLVINKTVLVMSHPSGEILYHFQVEIKDGKYRFWFTDFNFIPYQRDRYGNFVPTTTKGAPLENSPGKLNSSQWKEYQTQTTKHISQLANEFKVHMASEMPSAIPAKEKTVVKKDW